MTRHLARVPRCLSDWECGGWRCLWRQEYRRHRKWRERALQKRERRTLMVLYMILASAALKADGHVITHSTLLRLTMRGEPLLTAVRPPARLGVEA